MSEIKFTEVQPLNIELYTALAKFQQECKPVAKTKFNSFSKAKYADKEAILNTIKEPLFNNGLVCTQIFSGNNIVTRLIHFPTGQFIESIIPIQTGTKTITETYNTIQDKEGKKPIKQIVEVAESPFVGGGVGQNAFQDQGAAITYYTRYALENLLGLSATDDTDMVNLYQEEQKEKVQEQVLDKKMQAYELAVTAAEAKLKKCKSSDELRNAWGKIEAEIRADAGVTKLAADLGKQMREKEAKQ